MHFSIVVLLLGICCLSTGFGAVPAPAAKAAVGSPAAPVSNFYLEIQSFVRTVPRKQLQHLVRAYMLNDSQFQAVIREINSLPSYRLRLQLFNQPEVRQLLQWLSQQLTLAGGSLKVFEDLELEVKLFNKYPHWAQSVNGISGFEQELSHIYPLELLRTLLETNAKQSPVFAEFWRRVVALKPVYERLSKTPQALAFAKRLQALGVNIQNADAFIRYQLGWSNVTVSIPNYDYYDYLGSGF